MTSLGCPLNPGIILEDGSQVLVVSSPDEWEPARLQLIKAMGCHGVLGLDVEFLVTSEEPPPENLHILPFVPNDHIRIINIRKKKDPLLQLAAPKLAVLVQMCFFETFPSSLKELLDSREIIFVGVEIQGDRQRLQQMHKLNVRQVLDLRLVVRQSRKWAKDYDGHGCGLKSIGSFLGMQIASPQNYHWTYAVQNWASPILSRSQIEYAANDALAAVGSYIKLILDYLPRPVGLNPNEHQFWAHFRLRFRPLFNKGVDKMDKDSTKTSKIKSRRKMENAMHNDDSDIDVDLDEALLKCMDRVKIPNIVSFHDINQQSYSEDDSFNTANSQSQESTNSFRSNTSMVSISSQKEEGSVLTCGSRNCSSGTNVYLSDDSSDSKSEDIPGMLDKKIKQTAKEIAKQINEEQVKNAVLHVDDEFLFWLHDSGLSTVNTHLRADIGEHCNIALGIELSVQFE